MAIPLAIPLIAGGTKVALGAIQSFTALRRQKELAKQPIPQFTVSPELQRSFIRAEEMAKRGFTPEEEAAFRGGLARTTAGQFRRATDVAGSGLAQAIGAGIQAQNIAAEQEFAARGAGLKRKNISFAAQLASQIQQQKNLEIQRATQRRIMQEQAIGGAMQAGTENIVGGITDTAGLLAQRGLSQSIADLNTLPQTTTTGEQSLQQITGIPTFPTAPPTNLLGFLPEQQAPVFRTTPSVF